jgi:hypothetical protein
MRKAGKKIGLARLRMIRPFPHAAIQRLLHGRRGVAVIDQNISVGKGGILFSEIASALYALADRPPILLSLSAALAGGGFTQGNSTPCSRRWKNRRRQPLRWRDHTCF